MSKKILLLGANGFVGSALSWAILNRTDWEIFAIDKSQHRLSNCLAFEKFIFFKGDITKEKNWIETHIKNCDVVLPLAGIATPSLYIKEPLRVYELNFEANMEIIKKCVEYKKRIIFPSTSEIYGMCEDEVFDEYNSNLVLGPIHKERWIYASIKQLLDRVIWTYGNHKGLDFTLFRPFNFIGPKLDDDAKKGSSRVVTQFINNIINKEAIKLVDGGLQRRSFTFIADATNCLLKIIENKDNCASGKIFNIGNPYMNFSIKELAEILIELVSEYDAFKDLVKTTKIEIVNSQEYYGKSYQDISHRVPSIKEAESILGWKPTTDLRTALRFILDYRLLNKDYEIDLKK